SPSCCGTSSTEDCSGCCTTRSLLTRTAKGPDPIPLGSSRRVCPRRPGPNRVRTGCASHDVNVIDHYRTARKELDNGPFATTEITVRGVQMRVFVAAPPNLRMLWQL